MELDFLWIKIKLRDDVLCLDSGLKHNNGMAHQNGSCSGQGLE